MFYWRGGLTPGGEPCVAPLPLVSVETNLQLFFPRGDVLTTPREIKDVLHNLLRRLYGRCYRFQRCICAGLFHQGKEIVVMLHTHLFWLNNCRSVGAPFGDEPLYKLTLDAFYCVQ